MNLSMHKLSAHKPTMLRSRWLALASFLALFGQVGQAADSLSCQATLNRSASPVAMGKADTRKLTQPRLIIVSAPSGAGKSTLTRMLNQEFPGDFVASISFTTRAPRGSEVNGEDYHFVSQAEFKQMIARGDFAEWAEVHGNFYGTSKRQIEDHLAQGKSVLLVIDIKGASQIRQQFKQNSVSFFVRPPNLQILEKRLRDRATDPEEAIQKRLKNAIEELGHESEFDRVVINDDLSKAYEDFKNSIFSLEAAAVKAH